MRHALKKTTLTFACVAFLGMAGLCMAGLGITGQAVAQEPAAPAQTAPAQSASAAPAALAPVDLTYDIYAGGFNALHATYTIGVASSEYDLGLTAVTQNFIGKLFPWSATYKTVGQTKDDTFAPNLHISRSTWRGKVKINRLEYTPDGVLKNFTSQDGDTPAVKKKFKAADAKDAYDVLTGTLVMMRAVAKQNECAGSFPVFDGKRRFNITLKSEGLDTIQKSTYSMFSGVALKCTLLVEPVAGFKPQDKNRGWMAVQNHTEAHNKRPAIWFASPSEGAPVVPVRMEIASDYGSVVAHLTSAH